VSRPGYDDNTIRHPDSGYAERSSAPLVDRAVQPVRAGLAAASRRRVARTLGRRDHRGGVTWAIR